MMCKHCKNKKKIRSLEAEISQLKEMFKELEGKLDTHALHPYPYSYWPTVPYTTYTLPCTFYSGGLTTGGGSVQ